MVGFPSGITQYHVFGILSVSVPRDTGILHFLYD